MSKDKMILKDNTVIELETGADLAKLSAVFANKTELVNIWDKLTKESLSEISIQNGEGLTVGRYTELVLSEPNITATELSDGTIKAEIHLRKKTEVEKDIDSLKEGQAVQDGAIEDIAAVAGTLAEKMNGGVA